MMTTIRIHSACSRWISPLVRQARCIHVFQRQQKGESLLFRVLNTKCKLPSQPTAENNEEEMGTHRHQASNSEPIDVEPLLYASHVPTSCVEKAMLAAGSAGMALYNPTRDDMIAALGETTGGPALQAMQKRMQCDPVGQEILRLKPEVSTETIDMERLRQLPSDTFGYAYAQFMDSHGYSPNERPAVKYVDDAELAYVMLRYRQVHDFLHTLTGLPTSVLGEVVVKWFELLQTGLPMCALSSFFGPLQLTFSEHLLLLRRGVPWAVQTSTEAQFFMNIFYERHFDEQLDSLRARVRMRSPDLH